MHLSTCSVKHPLSKSRFDRETPVTQILQSENFKLGRVDKRIRNLFPYRWRRRWNLTILPGEEEIKFLESSKEIVNKFFYSLIAYQEYGKKHKKLFGPGARPGHLKKFRPSHAPPRVRTGHPTNSTQWRFTLPCGQGLHSTQLLFSDSSTQHPSPSRPRTSLTRKCCPLLHCTASCTEKCAKVDFRLAA